MGTPRKKRRSDYDYDQIADDTRDQIESDSKRKGFGGSGSIYKKGVEFTLFNPQSGEDYEIDIVPFVAGDNMPIDLETKKPMKKKGQWAYTFEFWWHVEIGPTESDRVICPEMTYGEPCPICEHRRELIADRSYNKREHGRSMMPKRRNLYNIICYVGKEEDKGVQLMNAAHFYFQKHIQKLASKAVRRRKSGKGSAKMDPFKNFADPSKNGVSIAWSIEKAVTKEDFDSWMGHSLENRDYDLEEALLDNALQLDQIVEVKSYGEIYELYYDEAYEEEDKRGRGRRRERDEEEEEEDRGSRRGRRRERDEEEEEEPRRGRGRRSRDEEEEEEPQIRRRGKGDRKGKRRGRDKEEEDIECPADAVFGKDYDQYEECDDCDFNRKCSEEYEANYEDVD